MTINLLLGVHNHQPVDNWDHVIEDAYQKCYKPFLDVLEAHPRIGMSVHYTGYLLDWIAEKHPELIEQLKRLVDRGQVEMFTGGFYEPILPIIPDKDKVGQIQKLTNRVKELTGQTPKGMWLAERVWEPHLVKFLAEAGVKYLCVDDAHFNSVGLDDEELLGRYTSEEMGQMVDIFPVSKQLRYMIPYAKPQEVVDYLIQQATESGERAGIYFDDGEKFGVWPGTYKAVYTEKWLDKFFTALEQNDEVIKTITPSQYVQNVPSFGRIYLPTASYSEMLEWALPAKHINPFEQFLKDTPEANQRFVRGGFWRHFLVKYPESNNVQKKMLYVSEKVRKMPEGPKKTEALDHLWQGQSNDIFWHGVFGGLYLTNLRTANYQHLIQAENLADTVLRGDSFFTMKERDLDCDGQAEVLVESDTQNLYLDPAEGGMLFELDFRPRHFNLLDTLARRYESYHDKLHLALHEDDDDGSVKNIHERVVVKEKGLEKLLRYDWHRRGSLLDHFLGPDTTLDALFNVEYEEQGQFINQPYETQHEGNQVTLTRTGDVVINGKAHPVTVQKRLTVEVDSATTTIDYTLTNDSTEVVSLWFAPEFNVNMLAPDAPDRYFYLPEPDTNTVPAGGTAVLEEAPPVLRSKKMASKGTLKQVSAIGLKDEWMGIDYQLRFSTPTDLWRFPIETVSQSEAGFEKVFQSTALYPNWKLDLAPGESWRVQIIQVIQAV